MTNISIECNWCYNISKLRLTLLSNYQFHIFWAKAQFVKALETSFICMSNNWLFDSANIVIFQVTFIRFCWIVPRRRVFCLSFGSVLLFGSLGWAERGDWSEHKALCLRDVRRAASNSPSCPPREPWLWFRASSRTTWCLSKWVT